MTSGGQCVMTPGTTLMLLWSASSSDMHTLEVSMLAVLIGKYILCNKCCHLMNFSLCLGGRAYSNAHFGAGSGPIFLDDVQCTLSSSQLLECPSRPVLSHNCLHSADAGVGCEGVILVRLENVTVSIGFVLYVASSSMYKWSTATGRR